MFVCCCFPHHEWASVRSRSWLSFRSWLAARNGFSISNSFAHEFCGDARSIRVAHDFNFRTHRVITDEWWIIQIILMLCLCAKGHRFIYVCKWLVDYTVWVFTCAPHTQRFPHAAGSLLAIAEVRNTNPSFSTHFETHIRKLCYLIENRQAVEAKANGNVQIFHFLLADGSAFRIWLKWIWIRIAEKEVQMRF